MDEGTEYQELKRKAYPILQKLISPEYIVYKDLPKKAEELLAQAALAEINNLVEVAKKRTAILQELEFFQKDFAKLLEPLAHFYDLRDEEKKLQDEAKKASLTRQELFTAKAEDIEPLFQERTKNHELLVVRMAEIAKRIKDACDALERRAEGAQKTIFLRLFEIFTGICPYKDLRETLDMLHATISKQLTVLVDQFYTGKISCQEFVSGCEGFAYDHDVVKLRNEISYRATRLKDVRDSLYELYREAANRRRLLELASGAKYSKEYRDLIFLCRAIKETIIDVENPFTSFSQATNKDEINYVFRSFWMKIEEYERKLAAFLEEFSSDAFLKAIDDLEAVVKKMTGTRPQLVSNAQRMNIETIESQYPFVVPLPFFMQMTTSALRQTCLEEAYTLYQKIEEVRRFAKRMQYIKTFEEERVDVILEGLQRQFFLTEEHAEEAETSWHAYVAAMEQTVSKIVDEVLLEIGLLDMHALADEDPVKLTTILRLALKFTKQQKEGTIQELFQELQSYCHSMFDSKVQNAARAHHFVAQSIELKKEYRKLVDALERYLTEHRGAVWIAECHKLRHILAREEEPIQRKLFDEIYKIGEITASLARGEDPLELAKWQAKFEEAIKAQEAVRKKQELPFIYLPGYIRYFTNE